MQRIEPLYIYKKKTKKERMKVKIYKTYQKILLPTKYTLNEWLREKEIFHK